MCSSTTALIHIAKVILVDMLKYIAEFRSMEDNQLTLWTV